MLKTYFELRGDFVEAVLDLFRLGVFFLAGVGLSSCSSFLSSSIFSDSDLSSLPSFDSDIIGSLVDESTCSLSSSTDKLLFPSSLKVVESETSSPASSSPDSDDLPFLKFSIELSTLKLPS